MQPQRGARLVAKAGAAYHPLMAVDVTSLKIVHYPAPVLRKRAKHIPEITDDVREVAVRMLELMHQAPGVGLAAPQVGLSWRMFVTCHTADAADDRVFINPKLSNPGQASHDYDEGCLSLPEVTVKVRRPTEITIKATDLDGNPFTFTDAELWSRVWQHEYDHLDGVLIIDKMSPMDRLANRKVIKELEAAAAGN
jgi:peptide deformylase